jgi:transcription elongation GreA/GreB family factor
MVAADRLRLVERDIRYVESRIERALPVDLSQQPHDEVAFGAIVEVVDSEHRPPRF